jgi:hypothetical protein
MSNSVVSIQYVVGAQEAHMVAQDIHTVVQDIHIVAQDVHVGNTVLEVFSARYCRIGSISEVWGLRRAPVVRHHADLLGVLPSAYPAAPHATIQGLNPKIQVCPKRFLMPSLR